MFTWLRALWSKKTTLEEIRDIFETVNTRILDVEQRIEWCETKIRGLLLEADDFRDKVLRKIQKRQDGEDTMNRAQGRRLFGGKGLRGA